MADDRFPGWHGTTILAVRRGGKVVVAGDGQVSLGNTVIKGSARKVRRLSPGGHDVVCGFAGSTADAFTLLERLEKKLESAPGQLARACVELAKDWRMDKYLRNLEAMLIVTDATIANRGVLETRSLPKKFLGRVQLVPKGAGPGLWARMIVEMQLVRYLAALLPFVVIPFLSRDLALPVTLLAFRI